MITILSHFERL